jgi:hypothetical protein
MADFPQRDEVHFPGNASPSADAPRNVAASHPQSAPLYYRLPVLEQPYGYAGVGPDGVVSIGVAIISHSREAHMRCAILVPTSKCHW